MSSRINLNSSEWWAMSCECTNNVTCGLHIKFPMSNQKYAHQEWQPDPACIFLPGFFSSSPFATCVQKYSFINRPPEEEAKWKCATHQAHMHRTNFHSPAFVFPLSTCVCVCVCGLMKANRWLCCNNWHPAILCGGSAAASAAASSETLEPHSA